MQCLECDSSSNSESCLCISRPQWGLQEAAMNKIDKEQLIENVHSSLHTDYPLFPPGFNTPHLHYTHHQHPSHYYNKHTLSEEEMNMKRGFSFHIPYHTIEQFQFYLQYSIN